jgi:hypothetical protein
MRQSSNVQIDRQDGRLVIRSAYTGVAFALIWTALLVTMLYGQSQRDHTVDLSDPVDLAVAALLLATGLFAMLPRRTMTPFEQRDR